MSNTVFAPLWVFILFSQKPPLSTLLGSAVILLTISLYIALSARRS